MIKVCWCWVLSQWSCEISIKSLSVVTLLCANFYKSYVELHRDSVAVPFRNLEFGRWAVLREPATAFPRRIRGYVKVQSAGEHTTWKSCLPTERYVAFSLNAENKIENWFSWPHMLKLADNLNEWLRVWDRMGCGESIEVEKTYKREKNFLMCCFSSFTLQCWHRILKHCLFGMRTCNLRYMLQEQFVV